VQKNHDDKWHSIRIVFLKHVNRLKKWLFGVAVLLLLYLIYIFLFATTATVKYKFTGVDVGRVEENILSSGTLKPKISVKVGAEVSGTVLRVLAGAGDSVTRGQVIATFDPVTFQARLGEAQAALLSNKADLARTSAAIVKAQAFLKNAKSDLARKRSLLSSGYISKQAYDAAENSLAAAQADYESAVADKKRSTALVNQALSTVQVAKQDLNKTIIRAPITGIVTRRDVEAGQTLAALFQAPDLFTIVSSLSDLKLEALVNEADIGKIAKGQSATFKVDAFQNKEFTAKVVSISTEEQNANAVQTGSNSYKVTLDVTDAARTRLLPNMSALIQIRVAEKINTLRVKNASLLFSPKLKKSSSTLSIKIVNPEEAKKIQNANDEVVSQMSSDRQVVWRRDPASSLGIRGVDVKLGVRGDDYTEIVSGDIKSGDSVAVADLSETTDDS
jgi:HlyD family secretion protein